MRQAAGPAVLQIGGILEAQQVDDLDLPLLIKSSAASVDCSNVLCDPAFLPFPEKTLSTVLLPHVLETHDLPHQVLREAHRVLQSDGHLVLTGFNPLSLLGLQNKIGSKAAYLGRYYSSGRVIDWLQLLGFEVVGSAMYQYAPLSKRSKTQKMLGFLETVGDRWLPMFGGGYMITAKKRDVGMTMIGQVKYHTPKPKLASAAPAKTSLNSTRMIS